MQLILLSLVILPMVFYLFKDDTEPSSRRIQEKYTTSWWRERVKGNISIQETAAYLYNLSHNDVMTIIHSDTDAARFVPASSFSDEEIVKKIKEKYIKRMESTISEFSQKEAE